MSRFSVCHSYKAEIAEASQGELQEFRQEATAERSLRRSDQTALQKSVA